MPFLLTQRNLSSPAPRRRICLPLLPRTANAALLIKIAATLGKQHVYHLIASLNVFPTASGVYRQCCTQCLYNSTLSCNKLSQTAKLDLHNWFCKCAIASYYLLPSHGNASPSLPTRRAQTIASQGALHHHAFMHLHQGPSCSSCMSHCCTDVIHIAQSRFQQPAMCCLASIILT